MIACQLGHIMAIPALNGSADLTPPLRLSAYPNGRYFPGQNPRTTSAETHERGQPRDREPTQAAVLFLDRWFEPGTAKAAASERRPVPLISIAGR